MLVDPGQAVDQRWKATSEIFQIRRRNRNADAFPSKQTEGWFHLSCDLTNRRTLNCQPRYPRAASPVFAESQECPLGPTMRKKPEDFPWNEAAHHADEKASPRL